MPSTHSSPESAGSAVDQSCAVIEKILGLSTSHRESDRGIFIDRGLYVIKQGSSYVMISVAHTGENRDQALVRVTAQVVAGVKPNEVMAAVHDVALAADRYDDQIVAQYGGRRMQDVIEESAWARLLKKAGDEPPHPQLDEETTKKAPASGGKKKGS